MIADDTYRLTLLKIPDVVNYIRKVQRRNQPERSGVKVQCSALLAVRLLLVSISVGINSHCIWCLGLSNSVASLYAESPHAFFKVRE